MKIRFAFVLSVITVCATACMPVVGHYYVPDGYSAESTEWVCFRRNRPICRMSLSDGLDLAVSTIDSGSTTIGYIVVIADRETPISVSKNEASLRPEGEDVVTVGLVTQSWKSKHHKDLYGEYFQYFTFHADLADAPSFLLVFPDVRIDAGTVSVAPIRLIRTSRLGIEAVATAW